MADEPIIHQIEWQGIAITITHRKTYPISGFGHIEVQANQRLPITETGYRSHFISDQELSGFKDAQDYVTQWLEATCKTKEWLAHVESLRQPSLFDLD